MNLIVAQPEVAARIAEPDPKLVPRPVEETRVVDMLLNQYWSLNGEVCQKKHDLNYGVGQRLHSPNLIPYQRKRTR